MPEFDPPPAKLFLKDIKEIAEVLREATTPPSNEGAAKDRKISFAVRDLTCESITDLQEIGGRTTEFTIQTERDFRAEVRLSIHATGALLTAYGVGDAANWVLYGRLRDIFQRRRVAWKALLHRIPFWFWVSGLAASTLMKAFLPARSRPASLQEVLLTVCVVGLILLLFYKAYFHTVVIFRYSREGSDLARSLKAWLPYLISAAVGGVATVLFEHLIRRLWP